MTSTPSRLDDLRTLRVVIIDVAFATAFITLIGGSFFVGLVKLWGGDDRWVGLVSAVPSFLGVMQFGGAIWGRSYPGFKRYVARLGALWRVFLILIIALPLLPWASSVKLVALLVCILAAGVCAHLNDPIYNDWLAEIIPAESRAWFYGRRGAVAAAVGSVAGLAGGMILDAFTRSGKSEAGYTTVFSLGAVFAVLSWIFFTRMKDRPRLNPQPMNLRLGFQSLTMPYRDPVFRRVILFLFFFVFGQTFMGGLLVAYSLEVLAIPMTLLQLCGVMHALGQVIMARWWGYFADKYGNKPVLAILIIGIVLSPYCWFLVRPHQTLVNAAFLLTGHIFSGMIWGGVGAVQLNLVVSFAKPEQRANYLAAGQSLIAITAGVSPLLGSILMQSLRGVMLPGPAYLTVLWVTTGLRFFSIFFLFGIKEAGAVSVRDTLRHLGKANPRSLRTLRSLADSPVVAERESAMDDIARGKLGLAVDELIKSLNDPTPRLRRHAADALARVGDPRGADALVQQLRDHPALVEEETIEALGVLGDESYAAELIRYLTAPRPQIRRAAARALGEIGGDDAREALVRSAEQEEDPDLRRAALQALRDIGDEHSHDAVAAALLDRHPSVRVAAAEAVVELMIVRAQPQLLESLATYRDEANSELVYALGAVGGPGHMKEMLVQSQQMTSAITRRRCLLGLARALGVESASYRLLLLEGMARDSALLEALDSLPKTSNRLREALALYSKGDEHAALVRLAESKAVPMLTPFIEYPIEEAFLVAALTYARAVTKRTKR